MNYFIIGDIHGCYYTFLKLLKKWNPKNEYLILVGDLIDRGNFSAWVVKKCIEIVEHNKNCMILKGNHEAEFVEYIKKGRNENWTRQGGSETLLNFKANNLDFEKTANWFDKMPLFFETSFIHISHAGISATDFPYHESNPDGVLWNRSQLKNIGKVQIHGHTPLKTNDALFNKSSNSWNIDSGAYYGFGLTGIKLNQDAKILETINIRTDERDIDSLPTTHTQADLKS